jgi:hypothetical protein
MTAFRLFSAIPTDLLRRAERASEEVYISFSRNPADVF